MNALFSFELEACCDLHFYSEKDSFLSHHYIAGQSEYCNPPWSLAIQRVEHVPTCHGRSPMNTKAVIVLLDLPQFNATTTGLRLLRQIPTYILVGKRHIVVKIPWPINYRVIDKDTSVKVSPTPMKNAASTFDGMILCNITKVC